MTKTYFPALEQACRNTRGAEWIAGTSPFAPFRPPLMLSVSSLDRIRSEYRRLMHLRARKKRWRENVSQNTKHQQAVNNDTVRG